MRNSWSTTPMTAKSAKVYGPRFMIIRFVALGGARGWGGGAFECERGGGIGTEACGLQINFWCEAKENPTTINRSNSYKIPCEQSNLIETGWEGSLFWEEGGRLAGRLLA